MVVSFSSRLVATYSRLRLAGSLSIVCHYPQSGDVGVVREPFRTTNDTAYRTVALIADWAIFLSYLRKRNEIDQVSVSSSSSCSHPRVCAADGLPSTVCPCRCTHDRSWHVTPAQSDHAQGTTRRALVSCLAEQSSRSAGAQTGRRGAMHHAALLAQRTS